MRQIMSALETMLKSGARLTADRLAPFATAAARLTELLDDGFWAHWAADFHVRAGAAIPAALATATARWQAQPKSGERRT
jgi:hypothetical protein